MMKSYARAVRLWIEIEAVSLEHVHTHKCVCVCVSVCATNSCMACIREQPLGLLSWDGGRSTHKAKGWTKETRGHGEGEGTACDLAEKEEEERVHKRTVTQSNLKSTSGLPLYHARHK